MDEIPRYMGTLPTELHGTFRNLMEVAHGPNWERCYVGELATWGHLGGKDDWVGLVEDAVRKIAERI